MSKVILGKPRKIVIISGNHLCHNPRVLKEAFTLSEAGFTVEILGAWFDDRLCIRDRALLAGAPFAFTPVCDVSTGRAWAKLVYAGRRLRRRAAYEVYKRSGVESAWQLGYFVSALERLAQARPADMYVAHSEQSMLVARRLLQRGHRVGIDMEDWFSEDLPPEARKARPIRLLRSLEGELLREAAYSSCPSASMSLALASAYRCPPPEVIPNAFAWSDRLTLDGLMKDRKSRDISSIHWFSQTLGANRGLEDLFAALPHLTVPVEIHLRGHAPDGFAAWLNAKVPPQWRQRVHVHGLVDNNELLSRIAEHDIGFAGEGTFCLSRKLTITNKILQYLLAGLAVVASDTSGQREVAAAAGGAVALYQGGKPEDLAGRITEMLKVPERLAGAKAAALDAAKRVFGWELIAPRLVARMERALSH